MSLLWIHAVAGRKYYHNSDAELNPGDYVEPASARGHKSRWDGAPGYSPNNVHMYSDEADPISYEEHGKHSYEVDPEGEVARDPEWSHSRKNYPDMEDDEVPGYHSYVAPRAKVVRRLY